MTRTTTRQPWFGARRAPQRGTVRTALLAGLVLLATGAGATALDAQQVEWSGAGAQQDDGRRLTLEEAVRIALSRNRQIRVARYTQEEAAEQVSEAWGNVFPSVDLATDYTRNVSPAVNFLPAVIFDPNAPPDEQVAVQFGADNTWNLSLNLEQPIFNAAAFIGVGAAGRFATLQEEVVRGQVHTVVTSVRTAYYDLLLAQEQARLVENSLRRVRESLGETRALNEAGLASDYDVLRLEVELANLEPNLLRARNAVRQTRRELGVALDLDDPEGLEVAGSLAEMDIVEPGGNTPENRAILGFVGLPVEGEGVAVEDVVALAERSRSDVRQAELTRELRETERRLEQVQYLPEVSVFGNYTINSSQNGDPEFFGQPRAYGRRVGVSVSLPVFSGFQRDARIDQKSALVQRAETEAAVARDRAGSEVRTLLDRVDEAKSRARGQRLAVEQARRGFEIASAQYQEGIGSQLELTDAEVALRESEFNYAEAVYDYLVARAQLDQATGQVPLVDEGRVGR